MTKLRHKIIPSVYLFLLKGEQILLLRRFNTGFHDGDYSVPAGHLDGDETMFEALLREVREEIGVKLNPGEVKFVHFMHRKSTDSERGDFFFEARKWQGEPKIMEPDKCDDLRWFPIKNLPSNTIPYIRQAITCYLDKINCSDYGWV